MCTETLTERSLHLRTCRLVLSNFKVLEKRCHIRFPVFLKKPVSTCNFRLNMSYTVYIILFGCAQYAEHSYIGLVA